LDSDAIFFRCVIEAEHRVCLALVYENYFLCFVVLFGHITCTMCIRYGQLPHVELCGVCVLIMFLSSAHTTEPIAIGNFEGYLTH